ncbi:hypothetical protein A2926_03930 [Candidatus Giovannonibacteria bacterium RIFCSPLOWO2_01_FULL_44_40]|uniref:Thioredoxin-like fold domain-containing protein n=1 Tax=Candidatus Giovannonibacteria bacterium RIFCSPHIGHO2_01_FULL_45_23 TaxID=1798325 RepID=A0A1F5VIZ7_9BACT|nr:MAG: hypothetical protein A2834_04090 [Candidatus Giovannonibacteria bacterium RIFCSPHIGHO2_01_FULL_45_23]OGF75517.1 MAG: hypothetical protein A3C77_00605 [Candidatus Giovannonibacteria bacterium RIFCSPHIGHO2_02_FULL_45_13]OGF80144.1 MAG: hypothetical protein A2926_03930 [Candidatus Giovannonibacteria bacterium RIFCSPLOWO2_01_FULL_44_40]
MILLQEINVRGCVDCKRFEKWWESAKAGFQNVTLEQIDATSPKGQEIVLKHSIMASPGIIVNGELFSAGGVNTGALTQKLKELGG